MTDISRSVQKFIAQHIHSVEQLEVLLFLRHHSDREWTASDIASELRATQSAIDLRLDDLTSRGFVARTDSEKYRYESSGSFDETINELADVYRTRRTTVIQAIFSGPSEAVRSFADAFRLGPEEEEDG